MKRRFILFSALLAAVALLGGRAFLDAPTASADKFTSSLDATLDDCTVAQGCDDDGKPENGEAVTSFVKVAISKNSSFLDASVTVFSGIDLNEGAVAIGDTIGIGSFKIGLEGATPPGPAPSCGSGGSLTSSFTIYNGHVHGVHDLPGDPSHTPWSYADGVAYDTTGWIADFDDDNTNNVPDSAEGNADGTSIAESIEDATPGPGGVPFGALGTVEPLFLPLLDAIVGGPHQVRGLGNAVIISGVVEAPVDFVTYENIPVAGQSTQIAAISSGSGLGVLPSGAASASTGATVTCPPFDTTVKMDAVSGLGTVAQDVSAGAGSSQFFSYRFSVTEDFDGDGVPGYNDNCDFVSNASQTDGDGDGLGAACDPNDAVASGLSTFGFYDDDGDDYPNWADNCPTTNATQDDADNDGMGDACDPDDVERGDGSGYGPFHDHDQIWIDKWTEGAVEGTGGGWAYTQAYGFDENGDGGFDSLRNSDDLGSPDFLPDLNNDGAYDAFALTDSDADGHTDGCETGSGSDALDSASTPAGAVAGDCDNDGTADGLDATPLGVAVVPPADRDGDKCSSAAELARVPKTGDPDDPFDFYSVPAPALRDYVSGPIPVADSGIGVTTDVVALLKYAGKGPGNVDYDKDVDGNGVPDGFQYDRSNYSKYGGNWPGPHDGGIGVTTDIVAMLAQSGFTCP